MVRKSLLFDKDECIGCFACEVACKQEHNIPTGEYWIRIFKVGPTSVHGKLIMHFAAIRCMHCGIPSCMKVCPVGAISKRSDGIVLFNEELCIGCKACIEACPFGAPQYNSEKDIVQACNLCFERVDKDLVPSCVHHCPTNALYFGDCNILTSKRIGKRAREGLNLESDCLETRIQFNSDKLPEEISINSTSEDKKTHDVQLFQILKDGSELKRRDK